MRRFLLINREIETIFMKSFKFKKLTESQADGSVIDAAKEIFGQQEYHVELELNDYKRRCKDFESEFEKVMEDIRGVLKNYNIEYTEPTNMEIDKRYVSRDSDIIGYEFSVKFGFDKNPEDYLTDDEYTDLDSEIMDLLDDRGQHRLFNMSVSLYSKYVEFSGEIPYITTIWGEIESE